MKITTILDYIEPLHQMYPDISEKDIKTILTFGWKQMYLHNSCGGDVLIKSRTIWSYIGTLMKNPIKFFNYYVNKLIIKLRVNSLKDKYKWDGYYYFALTDKENEEYKKNPNTYSFKELRLYKLQEECELDRHIANHFYRTKIETEKGFKFKLINYSLSNSEYLFSRTSCKLKDMIITNKKYTLLKWKLQETHSLEE